MQKHIWMLILVCFSVSLFAAMPAEEIRAGLESRDKALHIKDGWIRDPYIVLSPDGWYYLTGTTPLPDNPQQYENPYNDGLGSDSVVGYKMQAWRSKDLVEWEYLGTPYSILDGIWPKARPERFKEVDRSNWRLWAPEIHNVGGKWAIVHTSPSPVKGANLSLTKDFQLEGPYENPMGADIGRKHDPSLFKDESGTIWMIWGATQTAPLKDDLSGFKAKPTKIGPPNRKMGHEGCLMREIGDKYVLFGTGWSTLKMRHGSYNLYYSVADEITGKYTDRKFAGRFLGHGTPFQDKEGNWWCTAFFNADVPPIGKVAAETMDISGDAYTINEQGVTIVPMDIRQLDSGEIHVKALDPAYASPGEDEKQEF
ncbi:family 43 glycosylhydrolase [Sedimentisphaera salicampi]|uniref:Beta-xylosidase n=1 Tax=Sedimentisphaera salicampi TaxID=1941349 RepID=A0A1W6LMU4_9BACT|nr:family 43 glycosylhydrolase [Sedimentisphaera salicampi]ARN57108.1 Beta-xylosidase [Sedimentisphaera salicampi]OXU14947.1 Beta-xylosidase [Sedimentisphaera salicampi]